MDFVKKVSHVVMEVDDTDDIKVVDKHITFTREDMKNDMLAFLDWEIAISNGGHLKVVVYCKPTHTVLKV